MNDTEIRQRLAARIEVLEDRIQAACVRAGRSRAEVTIVAVTKSVSARVAGMLPEFGIDDLGESRPQILWEKTSALSSTIRWHQIGHLQRNKASRTVEQIARIHSADRVRLLHTLIEESARSRTEPLPTLLEINVSRELAKHGFSPEEVSSIPRELLADGRLLIDGLMCMAAYSENPEDARATFRELRQLRDRLAREWGMPLPHLSMGMSGDFEVGIEEGATFIRPGSVLFEGLEAED